MITLYTMRDETTAKLIQDGEESTAGFVEDLYNAVGQCAIKLKCQNENDLKKKIRGLFNETPESIICSSIHRAKGLESENVFIIYPHQIRLNWKGQQDWQKFQEQCCEYVAITRAKMNLYMITPSALLQ